MKVILQQDVKGQGKRGQLVNVSDGYARNFLFPKKLAVEANAENMNTMKMQDKAKKAQMAAEKAEAERLGIPIRQVPSFCIFPALKQKEQEKYGEEISGMEEIKLC